MQGKIGCFSDAFAYEAVALARPNVSEAMRTDREFNMKQQECDQLSHRLYKGGVEEEGKHSERERNIKTERNCQRDKIL